jgi:hypothetical protein
MHFYSILALFQRSKFLALTTLTLLSAQAKAQLSSPATNDTCASAFVVPGNITSAAPYLTPVVEVSNATTTGDPVLPPECAIGVSRSVWYKFTPTTAALYTFSLGADTATTVLDTVMAIYTSSSSACGPFTLFACNDDPGPLSAAISTNLVANTSYYIVAWVGPVTDVTNTPLNIQLKVSRPVVPVNDGPCGAEVIPSNGPFPYTNSITDTTLATETSDPPYSGCLPFTGARSVWYRFSPTTTSIYIFSTGSDTATTVDDTVMEIFLNTGGCSGTFTTVACNDNGVGRAIATASLTNGQTYYIVVWDNTFPSIPGEPSEYIPGETLVQLRVSRATAPAVVTL